MAVFESERSKMKRRDVVLKNMYMMIGKWEDKQLTYIVRPWYFFLDTVSACPNVKIR